MADRIRRLECPRCQQQLEFDAALKHLPFEHGGVVPGAVVMALFGRRAGIALQSGGDRHHGSCFSPSMGTGCQREYMLERTRDFASNPYRRWAMLQGTLWHEVMEAHAPPGWEVGVTLPSRFATPDGVSFRDLDGVLQYRWEGMWLSAEIDTLGPTPAGELILEDYKTQASPVSFRSKVTGEPEYYPPRKEVKTDWLVQLNLYGWMLADLRGLTKPPLLRVWLCILGIQRPDYAWTAIPVPNLSREETADRVRANYELFTGAWGQWEAAPDQRAKDQVIADLPLQGRGMFGGKKCTKYCEQKAACDGLLALNPGMGLDEV